MGTMPFIKNISPYEAECGSYTVTTPDVATTTAPYKRITTNNTTAANVIIPVNIDVPFKQDNVLRGIRILSYELTYAVSTQNIGTTSAKLYKMPTNSTTTTMAELSTTAPTLTGTAGATYQKTINVNDQEDATFNENTKFYIKFAFTPVSGAVLDLYNVKVKYELIAD